MIPADAILDAFINANILLMAAYLLWTSVRFGLQRFGIRQQHGLHLQLLNMMFLMVMILPLLMLVPQVGARTSTSIGPNLSDMVVSYYLQGGFDMKASEFERLLSLRDRFTDNILSGAGVAAKAVIAVFVLGVLSGTARLVFATLCLRRIMVGSFAWRTYGRVQLRLSDRISVPFSTRGVRNYYVVLPADMLARPEDMRVSLAHEFQHLRQGDIEWEVLLELIKPVFLFNPAFHAWKRQVEQLRELACDSAVLTRGRIGLRSYCTTLVNVCQHARQRDRGFVVSLPKVALVTAEKRSRASLLERRISTLLDTPARPVSRLTMGMFAAMLMLSTTFCAIAIQRPGDWSHDRLMLSTVVNLERLEAINQAMTFGRVWE